MLDDGKLYRRYYTDEAIENYILLQEIKSNLKEEDKNIRANVESTIHQTFHRLLKRNKIKYRGEYKCNWYVINRVLWVNFRRILKNTAQNIVYFMLLVLCRIMGHHRAQTQTTQIRLVGN